MACERSQQCNPDATLPIPVLDAATPDARPPPNIRAALRHLTQPAHDRLHAQPQFAALLRGDLRRPAYAALLLRLLGLHAPIEAGLARHAQSRWLGWAAAAPGLTRAARLTRDLRALGLEAAEIEAAPMADAVLPPLAHPAAALGCAWVVEGSALGGAVLAARLAATPGLAGTACGSFFGGVDGQDSGVQAARWRACGRAVEDCGAAPGQWVALRDAAVATFDAFETWLGPAA
jgi:heme oxygenase